jgi:hypothetical protein
MAACWPWEKGLLERMAAYERENRRPMPAPEPEAVGVSD